jgi:hypothetical protein
MEIQGQTRHKDPRMVERYTQNIHQAKNKAAQFVADSLQEGGVQKPAGHEEDLGDYAPLLRDSACGETIAWGFPILSQIVDGRFDALRQHGRVECLDEADGGGYGLVMRELTHEEAIRKYGPVTERDTWPGGEWGSIVYGRTRFLSKLDGSET